MRTFGFKYAPGDYVVDIESDRYKVLECSLTVTDRSYTLAWVKPDGSLGAVVKHSADPFEKVTREDMLTNHNNVV